jgi:murein DD-endopeptidase MepM/ murein hydrolase activator NlpD
MRASTRSFFIVALCACRAPAAAAQAIGAVGAAPEVGWRPARPLQGALVVLGVRAAAGDSVTAVRGDLAGEPLHFAVGAGWFRALGGVPFDAADSVHARLVIEYAARPADTLTPSLPVARRHARRERLKAAPEYVEPPDSLADRIRAEHDLVRDLKRRAHEIEQLWRGPFLRPRPSAITDRFGVARVFNGSARSHHLGVDFAGRPGSPVKATNRGVVAFAGDLYMSGTTIFIFHGAGLLTGYLHLSRALVGAGDTVATGQVIGRVGASGRVTGPHLHWLADYGDVAVDPLDLLTLDLAAPLGRRSRQRAPPPR